MRVFKHILVAELKLRALDVHRGKHQGLARDTALEGQRQTLYLHMLTRR